MMARRPNTSGSNAQARARDGAKRWSRQIVNRAISDLTPYARNARTHSAEQIAQIAASIREFGFTNPVLIDGENGIIAGHGRVLGAQALGMAAVPCIELAHLTEAQRRPYIIADNKLALSAGWDPELLRLELGDLKLGGFDLSLTGFDELELGDILAERTEGLTDPDEPFSGSGTTIIAAEQTGRACHAIEISPAYVDVAVQRWQDFSGKSATLDGDGRTFDEMAAERSQQTAAA